MNQQNFKDTRDMNGEYDGKITKSDVKKAYNSAYPQRKDAYVAKKEVDNQFKKDEYNKPVCYLVDGYNLVYSIDELKEIAKDDLTTARLKVIDLLCDFKAIMNSRLIVVFDAYKQPEPEQDYFIDGINVVYTKQGQLADSYIEQLTQKLVKDYKLTVVTSDALEQALVFAYGANRMSSESFVETVNIKLERDFHIYQEKNQYKNKPLEDIKEILK